MEKKTINLNVLTQQYRKKGAALRGFRTIKTLIRNDDEISLSILLRDHKESSIDSIEEVHERNNFDFLIDYYNILEIGLIAGYLPNPLPTKIENDIKFVLDNKLVNRYFTEFYPLHLPQLLLYQVLENSGKQYFEINYSENNSVLFDRFLTLNHNVKNDSDIQQFLWFLDDGWTEGFSIRDLLNVLEDKRIIKYKLSNRSKHPLNSALWGFVKYIQFLNDYSALLLNCEENTILQSAFWHHQSYWFEHIKEKFGSVIKVGINNIRLSINNLNPGELISDKKSFLNAHEEILELKRDSRQLYSIDNIVDYLLNDDFGEPLKIVIDKYSNSIYNKRKPDEEESGVKELAY